MATRRRPFVKIGRPKAAPKADQSPTESLRREVPASAFDGGGRVGYKPMPSHHDCPEMHNFKRRDG